MKHSFSNSVLMQLFAEYKAIELDIQTSQFNETEYKSEYPIKFDRFEELPELMQQAIELLPDEFISISYGGESKADNWHCDKWIVSLLNGRSVVYETEYKTGMGYRKLTESGEIQMKHAKRTYKIAIAFNSAKKDIEKKESRPVTPKKADVLHSLLMDASYGAISFYDFCEELGYNLDSIKHEQIHFECMKTNQALKQWINSDAWQAIEVATQNI